MPNLGQHLDRSRESRPATLPPEVPQQALIKLAFHKSTMSSQDDYEPSQDLGDSQLVLNHTETRARKAGEKAVVNMTRFDEFSYIELSNLAEDLVDSMKPVEMKNHRILKEWEVMITKHLLNQVSRKTSEAIHVPVYQLCTDRGRPASEQNPSQLKHGLYLAYELVQGADDKNRVTSELRVKQGKSYSIKKVSERHQT